MPSTPEPRPRSTATPPWVGRQLSWSKLEAIEDWQLDTRGWASPFWTVEADLQLAEGRLSFAEADSAAASASQRTRGRLVAARTGFERVLASDQSNGAQRVRARSGIERCGKSLRTPPTSEAEQVAGAVVTRAQWGASAARPSNMNRNRAAWRRITVHHSAMSNPVPLSGSMADSSVAVRRIQKAHMKTSGYGDIGYHLLIDPWGRVFQGRELTWQGAHAGGSNNVGNVGICLIGNFDQARPTSAALDSLERLVGGLRERYKISASSVVAHSDLKSTNCPGRNLRPWVDSYSGAIARR